MALIDYQRMLPDDGDPSISLRPDLQVATIRRGLQVIYVLKDPVNLKYYEFDEHDMELLKQLNGQKSSDDLCQWFNHRFPPLRLSHQALQGMLWRYYQQGLLVTNTAGRGRKVAARTMSMRRGEWIQRLSQPWAIRLPGVTPGPWLESLNRYFGWLFLPVFVGLACAFLILLLAVAFSQFEAIQRMTPDVVEVFSRDNLVLFGAAVVVTKMLHELGHAIAAYRHGCECHEIGILLLAGLPTLYCDVSDTWMLSKRWQRIVVSLAGIWVEILIAAVAFVVWSISVPGVVHAISFNVMLVCSVGTLLFNANPLVRYDGYYVLMDVAGISNLGQKSNEAIERVFVRWVLGSSELRRVDSVELPRWCVVYGMIAAIYRVMLTCGILWAFHLALRPFSLSFVVWLLASVGLTIWAVKTFKTGSNQVRRAMLTGTPRWRVGGGITMMAGLFAACAAIPLPWYVFGEAVLEPSDRQTLVAVVSGQLIKHKDSGTAVVAGDLIAGLENRDVQLEISQMEAELNVQIEHLKSLRARRNHDLRASEQIPGAEANVAALEHRLAHLRDERQRLEIRATESSIVYPATLRHRNLDHRELAAWDGSLLDSINQNAWVNAGDTICQTGTLDRLEAIAILAQDDLEAVAVGQRTDVLLISSGMTVRGEIAKISSIELDSKDDSAVGASLPRSIDMRGQPKLQQKWYQVQIRCLSPLPGGTRVRNRCKVRIHVGRRSFGHWGLLQFFKTFRWHV